MHVFLCGCLWGAVYACMCAHVCLCVCVCVCVCTQAAFILQDECIQTYKIWFYQIKLPGKCSILNPRSSCLAVSNVKKMLICFATDLHLSFISITHHFTVLRMCTVLTVHVFFPMEIQTDRLKIFRTLPMPRPLASCKIKCIYPNLWSDWIKLRYRDTRVLVFSAD